MANLLLIVGAATLLLVDAVLYAVFKGPEEGKRKAHVLLQAIGLTLGFFGLLP